MTTPGSPGERRDFLISRPQPGRSRPRPMRLAPRCGPSRRVVRALLPGLAALTTFIVAFGSVGLPTAGAAVQGRPAGAGTTGRSDPLSALPVAGRPIAAGPRSEGPIAGSVPNVTVRRMIVRMKGGQLVSGAVRAAAGRSVAVHTNGRVRPAGAGLTGVAGGGGTTVLSLPLPIAGAAAVAVGNELTARPDVDWAEPDWPVRANTAPPVAVNDPGVGRQWALWDADVNPPAGGYSIKAPAAWRTTTGAARVVVAVVDTGITDHPDLNAALVRQNGKVYGYDMIGDLPTAGDGNGRDSDPHDPGDFLAGDPSCSPTSSWHGTHVTGIIAATQNNSVGVSGVAPGVRVEPVRVLGTCGGYESDVEDGIRWATGGSVPGVPANLHPAKVVNLSLGGPSPCDASYQAAINDARSRGAVVVVAAGNDNSSAPTAPADCSGVINTAATGKTGQRAFYSNFGATAGRVSIAAPGGDEHIDEGIFSTYNSGTTTPGAPSYADDQGTSMAAPQVSGVVALMLSVADLTPDGVLQILRTTATRFPVYGNGLDCSVVKCGAGIVDAGAAVAAAAPPPPGLFHPLGPIRVLDTRTAAGGGAPLRTASVRDVQIAGAGGVPAQAVAVAVTLTATGATSGGFLTAFPAGRVRPIASNVNYAPGRAAADLAIVPLGVGGRVSVFNGSPGSVHLVVDVAGYFLAAPAAAAALRALPPTRLLDTRLAGGAVAGQTSRQLVVAGVGGVPATATDVAMTVTVTRPSRPGFLSAFPSGTPVPNTSVLNFVAGESVPNLVLLKIGSGGRVGFFNGSAGNTDLIVDIAGYVSAGVPAGPPKLAGSFASIAPIRVLDTRRTTKLAANSTIGIPISKFGCGTTPTAAAAINLTVVNPAAGGHLTVHPVGTSLPNVSNLNFAPHQTVANMAIGTVVSPAATAGIAVHNSSNQSVDLVIDSTGCFRS